MPEGSCEQVARVQLIKLYSLEGERYTLQTNHYMKNNRKTEIGRVGERFERQWRVGE